MARYSRRNRDAKREKERRTEEPAQPPEIEGARAVAGRPDDDGEPEGEDEDDLGPLERGRRPAEQVVELAGARGRK